MKQIVAILKRLAMRAARAAAREAVDAAVEEVRATISSHTGEWTDDELGAAAYALDLAAGRLKAKF